MAPKSTARTGAGSRGLPALWFATPASSTLPPPRSAKADRSTRAALFALLRTRGFTPGSGPWLSHSAGFVAYLCGAKANCGIDIEWIRNRDVVAMAQFAYDAGAVRALAALDSRDRLARFVDLWVLKEAAAKALGLDLFTALAQCAFEIRGRRIVGSVPVPGFWGATVYAPRPACRLGYFELTAAASNDAAGRDPSPALVGFDWQVGQQVITPARWRVVASTRAAGS